MNGYPKRLFDRRGVEALFARNWTLASAAERTTVRYGNEKTLWEIVAKKRTRSEKTSAPGPARSFSRSPQHLSESGSQELTVESEGRVGAC
ncbi:MAG: hypothetical protein AVDCRST_MAG02-1544 [uncultured Rubrobacteraceae bacterium]|uniref:Uncharacterized protein n=1 Tax=uncultured Rubrobacteraceae bacterium TaxID=349277 RepID=A0A6J4QUM1_9ACTN|nr:MAG: hypothetical protein AVDCRST_MAG02-1544 [uncultured Rubrobacteraceae bacterium]